MCVYQVLLKQHLKNIIPFVRFEFLFAWSTPWADSAMVWSVVGGFVLWGTQHRSMNGAKQTGWAIQLRHGRGMYARCV